MSDPIKVYAEKGHATEKDWVNHLVHPIRAFWGDGTKDWPKWEKGFLFYKDYFVLTDIPNDSDVSFLPLTLNYYINNKLLEKVDDLANKMAQLNKPLFIWLDGDHNVRYNNPNCIFLKYFGYGSKSHLKEFIRPGDVKYDLLEKYFDGIIQERPKNEIPSIGFDGIASYPLSKLIFTIFKNSINTIQHSLFQTQFDIDPIIPMLVKRKKILDELNKISSISTNFNIRNSFALGTIGGNQNARLDYVNNIINSDYTFCYRGAANYSLRFYETLCLGRIPLFINTDCVLPFENEIPWNDICLWIEDSEIEHLGEKITDYHYSMNGNQFREKQAECRKVWEKYLSRKGFYLNFKNQIAKMVPKIMDEK